MLHVTNRRRMTCLGLLQATLLTSVAPVHAQEVRLFPVPKERAATAIPSDPAQLPPLDAGITVVAQQEPAQQPQQAQAAAPSIREGSTGRGPLRVVIPNIHAEQKTAKKTTKSASGTAGVSAGASSRKPVENTPDSSTMARVSQAIYSGAQEAWQNGVSLAQAGGQYIAKAIMRPDIPFAPVPQEWQVASEVPVKRPTIVREIAVDTPRPAAQVSKLAAQAEPAQPVVKERIIAQAAQAAPAIQPAIVKENISQPIAAQPAQPVILARAEAPSVILQDTRSLSQLTPAAGNPPPPDTQKLAEQPTSNSQVTVDYSEPAPTLSTQSKNIAQKIPVIEPKKPKLPDPKVDIERRRAIGDILNKASAATPPAKEGLGIETKGAQVKFDVNYELERAYNALIAGKSDDAIRIYEDILTSDPRNKDALFGLASTYHRVGQIDIARALYGKLLEIDPTHRDGLNNFLVLLSDEAPQEALVQMQRLEQQNPGFSPIPAQMAIIYQKLGDRDKAVDKMYRALALSPENITYRYNLAIMLDKSGKYDQAGRLYSQVITAHQRGEVIPGDPAKIQQRLTFIRSNTH